MAAKYPGESAGVVMVWQRIATKTVHSSARFDVREDAVIRSDGCRDTFTHVIVPSSVTVLALDDTEQVVLTRQWIYTHGGTQWRLPGDGVEHKDVSPEAAARRALARGTGLAASSWERIGCIHGADTLSNHVDHLFLATGLSSLGEPRLRIRRLKFDDAVKLVRGGQLPHAGSAHALLAVALDRQGLSLGPPLQT